MWTWLRTLWRASKETQLVYGDPSGKKCKELFRQALWAELHKPPAFFRKQTEFMKTTVTQPVDCSSAKSMCLCLRPHGHDGPHCCSCGGSWDDAGEVLSFPCATKVPPVRHSDIQAGDNNE